jgi:hypothetical protein
MVFSAADRATKACDEILRAAGRPYAWPQVLAGAYFSGAAAALHAEVADALAALSYAREEGFEIPEDAGEAGEAFRIEHSLITGEETERWLGHCGISIEEFDAHFTSRLLAARFKAGLDEIRLDYAPAAGAVVDAMWTATILSGSFDTFTLPFARRVANRIVAEAAPDARRIASALEEGAARVPESLHAPGLLEELAAMEVLYRAAESEVASTARCEEELRERAFQLRRIVVAEAVFPSLDQANEAYQAVTADSAGLEDVAERAGVEAVEREYFADQAPEGAVALLSASPGLALEPQEVEDGFVLQLLRRRIEPDLADPDVAARVRGRLLDVHFDALVAEHVMWTFDPWMLD